MTPTFAASPAIEPQVYFIPNAARPPDLKLQQVMAVAMQYDTRQEVYRCGAYYYVPALPGSA